MDLRLEAESRAEKINFQNVKRIERVKSSSKSTTPILNIESKDKVDVDDIFLNQKENFSFGSPECISRKNETPRDAYLAEIDYKWNGYQVKFTILIYISIEVELE